MKPFTYERAATPADAAAAAMKAPNARFIAGGTNLLDLMKLGIESPTHLIDVNGLALVARLCRVVEIGAARALQQVAGRGGAVAQLA